jgi:hypothetical protein
MHHTVMDHTVETPIVDRPLVILAIRGVRDELELRFRENPRVHSRYMEGDLGVVDEARDTACFSLGIRLDDYRRVIESEPLLLRLEVESILEATVGSADPGPYDRISRESPSGSDENEHWIIGALEWRVDERPVIGAAGGTRRAAGGDR